jgi:hypothetical protein
LTVRLVIAGLLAVCVGVWYFWPRPQVVIEISGSPGIKLVGTIHAGQATGRFGGQVPHTITARARSVSYMVQNLGKPGTMTVRVLIDGKLSDTITADGDHSIVRGTVEGGRVSQTAERSSNQ